MFFLYQIILSILLLFSPFIIVYRILKNKENKKRFLEKFGFFSGLRVKGKLIWFHGASVGEIMSIIPLIKKYEDEKSIKQILVTSSTLSSSKIIKQFKFKKTLHQFYPVDYFFFTNKFLKKWKPSIAIFVESEIWPCMFSYLKKKNIPLILLNARLSKKTFKKWMRISTFSKSIFGKITISYPQNIETKNFLKKIGSKKIKFIGNLKFIENYQKKLNQLNIKLRSEFDKRNVWIASSTHKNEEMFCAQAHILLHKKINNLLTIIIPRHIHRAKDIAHQLKYKKLNVAFHSAKPKKLSLVDIYIVDTFGETKKFHNIGSTVFFGGSIINRGGQNPLEAARFGAKVLHGPNIDNFKDVYNLLDKLKISKKINTPKQLASSIVFYKNKNKGIKIKNIGEKILKKTIRELDYLINNDFKKT